jgi:hypothetical protein
MNNLSTEMAGLNVKRTYVETFLDVEVKSDRLSGQALRLKLARAKNKKQSCSDNMRKAKERCKKALELMREKEAELEVACEEVRQLTTLLERHERDAE